MIRSIRTISFSNLQSTPNQRDLFHNEVQKRREESAARSHASLIGLPKIAVERFSAKAMRPDFGRTAGRRDVGCARRVAGLSDHDQLSNRAPCVELSCGRQARKRINFEAPANASSGSAARNRSATARQRPERRLRRAVDRILLSSRLSAIFGRALGVNRLSVAATQRLCRRAFRTERQCRGRGCAR